MRIIFNVSLKFGDKLLTSLTKLEVQGKDNTCSKIKENLHLCCPKLSTFVVVVRIKHIF